MDVSIFFFITQLRGLDWLIRESIIELLMLQRTEKVRLLAYSFFIRSSFRKSRHKWKTKRNQL
jgi:hypothetical protein